MGPQGPKGDTGPQGVPGPAGSGGSSYNPQALATLRWYSMEVDPFFKFTSLFSSISDTRYRSPSLDVKPSLDSRGVAFDGETLWVANYGDDSVALVRAEDGAILGEIPLNLINTRVNPTSTVAKNPIAVVYAGDSIWIANYGSNNLAKFVLRRNQSATIKDNATFFQVGINPFALAFDGANIWVTNSGDGTVMKLRASDGATLGIFTIGGDPRGIAFDGANMWVAIGGKGRVVKLRASDGLLLGDYLVGISPVGVAFDGANIWVTNSGSNKVSKLRASDGNEIGLFTVGTDPRGIVFDGANVWVANFGSNTVTKLRASNGAVLGTLLLKGITRDSIGRPIQTVFDKPYGMAFDGTHVWVTSSGQGVIVRQ